MQRLLILVALIGLVGASAGGRPVEAETLAPDALDPRLAGYPELLVRLAAERIEAPARAIAGRTLLVEENLGSKPGHVFILRIPDDVSEADVAAAVAPGRPPIAADVPEWFWRGALAGNPDRAAPNGGRAAALVDLAPGRYLVADPYRPASESARFEVIAGPTNGPEAIDDPAVDVVVSMREMAFDLPTEIRAGSRVWKVDNTGWAPHELAILPVPAGATAEQVIAALGAALATEAAGATFETQTAPADMGLAWTDWRPELVAGVGATSPRRSVWAQIDLKPGTYAAVCFVPDPTSFTPHLMMGMTTVFTVGATAA